MIKTGLFAPIRIELDGGRIVNLRGKIDRVDMAKIEDKSYFRVVDYKSSNKSLKLSDIKDGISLQLMTYMAAMLENKEKVTNSNKAIPAALSYFTLNTSAIYLTEYEKNEDLIKKKIIQALKLKGIYLKNVEILKYMDYNAESTDKSYLDVNLSRMTNEEKYLTEEKFEEECKEVKQTLKDISQEIVKGTVRIKPSDTKNCDYCSYKSVCRRKNTV